MCNAGADAVLAKGCRGGGDITSNSSVGLSLDRDDSTMGLSGLGRHRGVGTADGST